MRLPLSTCCGEPCRTSRHKPDLGMLLLAAMLLLLPGSAAMCSQSSAWHERPSARHMPSSKLMLLLLLPLAYCSHRSPCPAATHRSIAQRRGKGGVPGLREYERFADDVAEIWRRTGKWSLEHTPYGLRYARWSKVGGWLSGLAGHAVCAGHALAPQRPACAALQGTRTDVNHVAAFHSINCSGATCAMPPMRPSRCCSVPRRCRQTAG